MSVRHGREKEPQNWKSEGVLVVEEEEEEEEEEYVPIYTVVE